MNKVKETLIQIYDKVIEEDKIYLVKLNGKYGVVDKDGNELIEPKYTALGDEFREGLLGTWGEGGLGFIDDNGKEIIPCQYHNTQDFSNGLAGVRRKGEKWGFINKQGEEVIPPTFDEVLNGFSEKGVAEVKLNKETFYIDKRGEKLVIQEMVKQKSLIKVLRSIYDYVESERNIYIVRIFGNDRVLDKKGNLVTKTIYDKTGCFEAGRMMVHNDDGYGYIDSHGKEVIRCQYSDYKEFKRNGLAGVCNKYGKWGFINKHGNEVIPFQYDWISTYLMGAGRCVAYVEQDGKGWYIDKHGNKLTRIGIRGQLYSYIALYEDGKFSYPEVSLYLNSIENIKVSVDGKRIVDNKVLECLDNNLVEISEKNIDFPVASEIIGIHRTTWNNEPDGYSCYLNIKGDFDPMKLRLCRSNFVFNNKEGSYSDTIPLLQEVYYDGTKLMLEKNEDIYWHGEYVSLPYLHKEINGGDTTCKLIWGSGIEIIKKNFPLLYEK